MSPVPTDPFNFINGATADAEQVDARFAPLYAALAGALDDSNVASIGIGKLAAAAWATHAPSLTNVAGGANTVEQRYAKLGRLVVLQGHLVLGAGGGVNGDVNIALPHGSGPVAAAGMAVALQGASSIRVAGYCGANPNASASYLRFGRILYDSGNAEYFSGVPKVMSNVSPWSLTEGDELRWSLMYESAA